MCNENRNFKISGVWCEFLHDPGTKYRLDRVEEVIRAQTEALAGNGKCISHKEINLKVFSNKVVELTLVDLPGIVKVINKRFHIQSCW